MKKNNNNNFDILRLFLASSVVWHHFLLLTQTNISFFLFDVVDREVAVKAFFVISGALIWASGERTQKLWLFVKKRAFRVYPAYILVLLISVLWAFIVYEADFTAIFSYFFWNSLFLNFINPCIENVFQDNVICAVNGSLWTLKLEVGFYAFVGFCFYGFKNYRKQILVLFTILSIAINIIATYVYKDVVPQVYINQLPFLFFYFGIGALVFTKYKEISQVNNTLLFAFASFLYLLNEIFYPLFVITLVFYIGFGLPFKINLVRIGDLSYGSYIYHFPIIQILVASESLSGNKYFDIASVFGLVYICSLISWKIVEKPFLNFSHRGKA